MNAVAHDPFSHLPQEMRRAPRWLLWKSIPRAQGKKPIKAPFYADGTPRSGKLDTPEDRGRLATFDAAVAALAGGDYAGLGFALGPDASGHTWQGVDLDGVGQRAELQDLARRLPGFIETSPSGNGVHAIGYGRPFAPLGSNVSGIEAYSSGRYFTVTGKRLNHGPITDIADFVDSELRPMHGAHKAQRPSPGPAAAAARPLHVISTDPLDAASPSLTANLQEALRFLDSDEYATWISVGHALKPLGEVGRDLWHQWSASSMSYDPAEADAKWSSFKPERTGYPAIFAAAQRQGWHNPASRAQRLPAGLGRSEEDLALAFAQENEAALRYCNDWGQWLIWDGVRWTPDTTQLAICLARDLCRRVAAVSDDRTALALGRAQTVSAVARLAQADRRLAATSDQWDADPWLLNTPGGVVDLKTGRLRPSDPALHMTKVTGAAPDQDGVQPVVWLRFLERITNGDRELQSYLQRVLGYALTGDTSAQALFFGYGTGANGKSVMIDTVAGLLGDYHKTAPIETFTESGGERHPTELAMLRGARLVTAAETEEGRRWAESRIKTLTGGDEIAARFMRQDFFFYTPQFKLFVAGNHRPGLRSVDEAMRRRFHLVPFAVTIPPEERDPALTAKLRAEWPAILAWMIKGCVEWQRVGLASPPAVRAATDAYLEGEDALAAWIDEACQRDPQAWGASGELFASWKGWAERHGEPVRSAKWFVQALEGRGFTLRRTNQARGVVGLRLKPLDFPA
ncbi:phage/plasmid primase, P4 family [Phenylobacterium sp.]|uniref:phage/plasmid primase, P4 family n=1 Tax=Phenylobacterium sp. TaxID=1871053 RepID=UPI002C089214|nr:phage/plasmid primase, P4 family [Phenylobacterium sp.]HVI33181.1 phage/plasmid primase, P4 family [Phenylobacterium sp.]